MIPSSRRCSRASVNWNSNHPELSGRIVRCGQIGAVFIIRAIGISSARTWRHAWFVGTGSVVAVLSDASGQRIVLPRPALQDQCPVSSPSWPFPPRTKRVTLSPSAQRSRKSLKYQAKLRKKMVSVKAWKFLAGEPGFEPGLTESESVGLPLTYSPAGGAGRFRHAI